VEKKLGDAFVKFSGNILEVSTGKISRKWEWRGSGFATVEMIAGSLKYGRGLTNDYRAGADSDYNIFGLTAGAKAVLRSADARIDEDTMSSPHIEIELISEYPQLQICVKYVIWVYPGANGLRTQLFVKSFGDYKPAANCGESITETVEFCTAEFNAAKFNAVSRIKAAGYYNDTQNRNRAETEIIREEDFINPAALKSGNPDVPGGLVESGGLAVDWANLAALIDKDGNGICVVKESNKCVNQSAYETGAFKYKNGILKVTGAGFTPDDICEEKYLFAWAAWTIFFNGGDDGLQTAVKEFDRLRYPVNSERDIYIMANNWGTSDPADARDTASAENVLKDIPVAAEIGVDVVQVDDGWQFASGVQKPSYSVPWYVHKDKYPDGWEMITKPARELGLKLGLWFAWTASADEMIDNMKQGDFKYFKIDFANLKTRAQFDSLYEKAVKLYRAGEGKVRINWDATEIAPRMGYFFGREFGNIYLENRKPFVPEKVVYVPYLVLRDAWQVAKFTNINKFQVTLQNLDLINKETSDAHLHNFPYCAMISFMGSPIFFQQVQFLSAQAITQLKKIIAVYKKHREQMYSCYVYPVGEKPDNSSWTGFQFVNGDHGYIVVFRELNNKHKTGVIKLKFLRNINLDAVNVMTTDRSTIKVDDEGRAEFSIADPCGFVWYQYGENNNG